MERKPDGSLYRMTPKQHREAVRLHRQNRAKYCANCKAIVHPTPQGGESKNRGVKHEDNQCFAPLEIDTLLYLYSDIQTSDQTFYAATV